MNKKSWSVNEAKAFRGVAVVAQTPEELHERFLPRDGELVAWRGPWRYYKAFPVQASAAHETAEKGAILRWTVGEFSVRTNHPEAEGTPRSQGGLISAYGHRSKPPRTYDELHNWVMMELGSNIGVAELAGDRPELPEIEVELEEVEIE